MSSFKKKIKTSKSLENETKLKKTRKYIGWEINLYCTEWETVFTSISFFFFIPWNIRTKHNLYYRIYSKDSAQKL